MTALVLRAIGKDDYTVIDGGEAVGRIRLASTFQIGGKNVDFADERVARRIYVK